jgi:hypothetical protein
MVMAAKITRLTHKIAIQLHLVAENCTICISRSWRPVRKLLDTPSYIIGSAIKIGRGVYYPMQYDKKSDSYICLFAVFIYTASQINDEIQAHNRNMSIDGRTSRLIMMVTTTLQSMKTISFIRLDLVAMFTVRSLSHLSRSTFFRGRKQVS